MKMSKRLTAALCAAAALVLLLAGCGGSGGSQNGWQNGGPAAVKDSVTKRKLSDQTTFDPYKTSDQNMWEDLYGIYDTLFREDELGRLHSQSGHRLFLQ